MSFRVTQICLVILLLPIFCSAEGVQLYSASPSVSSPGGSIQILGEGFSAATRVVLGGQELIPTLFSAGQLQVIVPQLDEGEYALQLMTDDKVATQNLRLRIEIPPPSISSLSPSNINECSTDQERQVSIRGSNFQPGLKLLLNGAAVAASVESEQLVSFDAPHLNAGIYGLQVINPNGKRSLPHSLYFNNIPKIYSMIEGENHVSSYQLVIQGKNFYPYSTLVVREYPGFGELPPRQRIITARDAGRDADGSRLRGQGDYLNYIDCNTLIYYRFPVSGQAKQLSLQIINRDGKTSSIEQISTP